MLLTNKRIAIGITSSFYAIEKTFPQIEKIIKEGAEIIPIMSFDAYNIKIKEYIDKIEEISKREIIHTAEQAKKIGYEFSSDIMAIIPCSGNTIGKLANGIIDTPVLIAAKNNLKIGNNIVIGIATNDGLSLEAENIGKLFKQKNIFFVPFRQDNPITKPNSLLFSSVYIKETIERAIQGEQIEPLLLWRIYNPSFLLYN